MSGNATGNLQQATLVQRVNVINMACNCNRSVYLESSTKQLVVSQLRNYSGTIGRYLP